LPVTGRAGLGSPQARLGRWVRGFPVRNRPVSPMEGTSGAADLALLRGGVGDAALGLGCVVSACPCASVVRSRGDPLGHVAFRPAGSYPSRGWGLRGGIVKGVALPRVGGSGSHPAPAHGGSGDSSSSGVRQCRSLHLALQRSHDERCPSGSGWGSGVSRPPVRANARRKLRVNGRERLLAAKHASPWPVKPRLEPSKRPDGADSRRACPAGLVTRVSRVPSPGSRILKRHRKAPARKGARAGVAATSPFVFEGGWYPSSGAASAEHGGGPSGLASASPVSPRDEDRTIPGLCSRAGLVAEVDERRSVQPKGHGSSHLPYGAYRARRLKG